MKCYERNMFHFYILLLFIILLNPTSASDYRNYWPTEEWENSTPKAEGMNKKLLDEMMEYNEQEHLGIDSIVIIRKGYIVFEEYPKTYKEFKHYCYSITKSFISCLVGIAYDKNLITSLDTKILDFFRDKTINNYDPRKENITILNLLTMSTGLTWEDILYYGPMQTASDQVEFVLGLEMINDPGEIFNYDSGGTHLLSAILQNVTGQTTLEFAEENLFNKIGIKYYSWDEDFQGINYGGWGLYMSTRDIARLGYLYLNNGTWDGEQIVSKEWVRTSIQPFWLLDASIDYSYGYLWWLRPYHGDFSARGYLGQFIYIIPEYDLVVAIHSNSYLSFSDYLIDNYIVPSITDTNRTINSLISSYLVLIFVSLIYKTYKRNKKRS